MGELDEAARHFRSYAERYPDDAEKPVISGVDPGANAMAWFILVNDPEAEEPVDVPTLLNFTEEYIKPEFERVEGVG